MVLPNLALNGAMVWLTSAYIEAGDDGTSMFLDKAADGLVAVSIVYSTFIALAVIRSAFFNRRPRIWGWLAIVFAGLGLARTAIVAASFIGLMAAPWHLIQREAQMINQTLPAEMADGLRFDRIATDSETRSVTMAYSYLDADADVRSMNTYEMSQSLLQEGLCEDFDNLSGTVKALRVRFSDPSGRSVEVELTKRDCQGI